MTGRMIGILALALLLTSTACRSLPVQPAYENAAVAADHPLASRAGVEMLRKGGNAVDAAVAASFCLSVVDPFSCGIGGGGFMLIWDPQSAEGWALNYRETAPAAINETTYVDMKDPLASRFGAWSVGVPGTVAGLLEALDRWGTLDRDIVLAPAIRHAEKGFAVNAAYISAVDQVRRTRETHPELQEMSRWLWEHLCLDGRIRVGDILRQPEQAAALRLIARDGAAAFYGGPIGKAIASTVRRHGGAMTAGDVAGYVVNVDRPLASNEVLGNYTMLSMPPPSSGGIAMQQMLRIIDARISEVPMLAPRSPGYIHLITEAMKHAFADRATHLADGQQVAVPMDRLLDRDYLLDRARSIDMDRTGETFDYGSSVPPPDDSGTSHLSVVDSRGMAVACTETINLGFGSMLAVPEYGIVLNDELDDFTTNPGEPNAFGLRQSVGNAPAPGKRPLSSMSPTIILEDGDVRLVAGASGGPRIITGTFQVILNCLLFDMTPVEAVMQARFHHQWLPDTLQFEEAWTRDDVIEMLEARGHVTGRRDVVGVVQIVEVVPGGAKHPASDPRKGGVPDGF